MEIGSSEWSNLIANGARRFGIQVDRKQLELFAVHAAELLKWNRKINLTTITDPYEIAVKHFLDSLAPANLICAQATLLDIGSGGGFPGLPLKICMPSLSVTLIDASRKKVNFMKHVLRMLKLQDIQARHIRAEDLAHEPGRANAHDVIISRALSSLPQFASLSKPLLKRTGVMVALKAQIHPAELEGMKPGQSGEAVAQIGKERFMLAVKNYKLPYVGAKRSIVTIRHQKPALTEG